MPIPSDLVWLKHKEAGRSPPFSLSHFLCVFPFFLSLILTQLSSSLSVSLALSFLRLVTLVLEGSNNSFVL